MPGLGAVVAAMVSLGAGAPLRPAGAWSPAFTLPERDLIPAGIACDPRTRTFFVGSVRRRKILRRSAEGAVSEFVREGQDGILGVFALAVDPPRRLLWAYTGAVPAMDGWAEGDLGLTALFAYDLDSGRLARKIYPEFGHGAHGPSALAVDPAGAVYLADSAGSGLYRIAPGEDRTQLLVRPGVFRSPRGLALSEDGRGLYVSDSEEGLWRVDTGSGIRQRMPAPGGVAPSGLDGLARSGRSLIAVRGNRVVRLDLSPAGDRIVKETVLAGGRDLPDPAPGVAVEGDFYTLADGGRSFLLAGGKTPPRGSSAGAVIVRIPLGP